MGKPIANCGWINPLQRESVVSGGSNGPSSETNTEALGIRGGGGWGWRCGEGCLDHSAFLWSAMPSFSPFEPIVMGGELTTYRIHFQVCTCACAVVFVRSRQSQEKPDTFQVVETAAGGSSVTGIQPYTPLRSQFAKTAPCHLYDLN